LGDLALSVSPEQLAVALDFVDKLNNLQPYQLRVIAAALQADAPTQVGRAEARNKGGDMTPT
jgi:hypothetical protein